MTESEFNKKRDELIDAIGIATTLEEKLFAYSNFTNFMSTKSKNPCWNPKYRKNRVILLPNGTKIPWELCNPIF